MTFSVIQKYIMIAQETLIFHSHKAIWAIVFGAEYNFAKKQSKLNPFIGVEGMVNVIGGKLKIIYSYRNKRLHNEFDNQIRCSA